MDITRREVLTSAVALLALESTGVLAASPSPSLSLEPVLNARPLFSLRLDIGPSERIGAVPGGIRTIFPIVGGTFEGPLLRGKVRPGGADWALQRADGLLEIDLRLTLEAQDGALPKCSRKFCKLNTAATLEVCSSAHRSHRPIHAGGLHGQRWHLGQ